MKINKFKLVYNILFTKRFFTSGIGGLKEVIEYALNHHNNFRGEGSSDVALFIANGRLDKILDK
jgi:hypothetical protein